MWRENPATTMVIGWDQVSGTGAKLYFDTKNHGRKVSGYRNYKSPAHRVAAKDMNNYFVRLSGLQPNTVYYFVIKDSEGVSQQYSFRTAPDNEDERLSIIAGGDSRNHREARLNANQLVSKLRPHAVLFSGDMTDDDTGQEWIEWFDDWQSTFGSDRRIFPIIVTRGNHEASNQGIVDLFDVKNTDVYYALNLGGDLLRVYTLNTLIPSGGAQKLWLQRDLQANTNKTWKFAQYHQAMRPHVKSKPEKTELILNWATLFHKFNVDVAVESDAHVVKWTYPIRPSRGPGSQDGFIRDDDKGTVYIGEGCWGAPLRDNNDNKVWTRASASFNQFKWIFVDKYKIEIRTIKTDGASNVAEVQHNNVFRAPRGLEIWKPKQGSVIRIFNKNIPQEEEDPYYDEVVEAQEVENTIEVIDFSANRKGSNVLLKWTTLNESPAIKFEIQRSIDAGNAFRTVDFLRGKGMGSNEYEFVDRELNPRVPTNKINYRLKIQKPSGQEFYFNPPSITESSPVKPTGPPLKKPSSNSIDWSNFPKLIPDPSTGRVKFKYAINSNANVVISLINKKFQEASRTTLPNQIPKTYLKSLDLNALPGGNYLIVIKANGKVIRRFRVEKI